MYFLDDSRPKDQNDFLLAITRITILKSAVNENIIKDLDLATIPETIPPLANLASTSRDDMYGHIRKMDRPPILLFAQKVFCYNFAKGVESAYLWNQSSDGNIDFSYKPEDAINGLVGAQVSSEFQNHINFGIMGMENVFCDFQDQVVKNEEYGFSKGGRLLADAIACSFLWASSVGVDYGMDKLGFE